MDRVHRGLHPEISSFSPSSGSDVSKPRSDPHQSAMAIRESSDHSGQTSDFTYDPLEWVVGLDLPPMISWEDKVGQRIYTARGHHFRGSHEFHRPPLCSNFSVPCSRRFSICWRVDRLEHARYLGYFVVRCMRKHIAVHCRGQARQAKLTETFIYLVSYSRRKRGYRHNSKTFSQSLSSTYEKLQSPYILYSSAFSSFKRTDSNCANKVGF